MTFAHGLIGLWMRLAKLDCLRASASLVMCLSYSNMRRIGRHPELSRFLIGRPPTQPAFGRHANTQVTSGRRSCSVLSNNHFCKCSAVVAWRRKTSKSSRNGCRRYRSSTMLRLRAIHCLIPKQGRLIRKTGGRSLSSVGHRLAVEMDSAKSEEKIERWQNVVGPVFRGIWPLDVELQTPAATFTLVRILLASGAAFPEAADVIIPFIQPDDPRSQSTVHSIAEADEALYKAAPSKMLDMLVAVVGVAAPGSVYALGKALSRLRTIAPALGDSRKLQKLLHLASQH
ncbi:hypothetical protein ACVWZW_002774 [Bradyrhizobium sp. F1.13.4]